MKTALTKVSLLFVLPRCIRRGAFGITGEMVDRLLPNDGVVIRDLLHTAEAIFVADDDDLRDVAARAAADLGVDADSEQLDMLRDELKRGRETVMSDTRALAYQFTGCDYDASQKGTFKAILHLNEIYELWTWAVQARLAGHEPSEVLACRDRLGPLADKLMNGEMPDFNTN